VGDLLRVDRANYRYGGKDRGAGKESGELKNREMSTISFETTPIKLGDWTILRLPESASAKLPSRGMALVEGTINGFRSIIVLEPDGKGSHWFKVDAGLREATGIDAGDMVTMVVEPSKEWPEPDVPADLSQALAFDPQANAL
jgi:hypothetical protein